MMWTDLHRGLPRPDEEMHLHWYKESERMLTPTQSRSTTMLPHSLQRKHRPPQRKVISWVVTLQQFQHHTWTTRAWNS